MAIDPLGSTKSLKAAGVARQAAEVHAYVLLQLVAKTGLDHSLKRLEHCVRCASSG
jgi:hypothetical protein